MPSDQDSIPFSVPPPVFLGFCPKQRTPLPEEGGYGWAGHVVEVGSVSDCLASRPPGWIARWDFNRASCWDDEARAWACVPAEERDRYALFAYRAFPLLFDRSGTPTEIAPGEMFPDGLPDLPPEPDMAGYDPLGYDIVQYAGQLGPGCSPLSCNHMGAEHPVNRYGLLDRLEDALRAARAFGREEPEPGPFIICQVLRKMERTVL